jgi:ATP-dependent Clp endopeptidase proteolytic subunit ClpP
MLEFLGARADERKLRLFAVGCARRLEHLLADERSRAALEVAERYADGLATAEDLASAAQAAGDVAAQVTEEAGARATAAEAYIAWAAPQAARAAAAPDVRHVMSAAAEALAALTRAAPEGEEGFTERAERRYQSDLLRCLLGNPFRVVGVDPGWRTWNEGTVVHLARAIYERRSFDQLAILADALEEAGCTESEILSHCRGPGAHARGCWVLDRLLRKGLPAGACEHKQFVADTPFGVLLTQHRVVLLRGPLTEDTANVAVACLLYLQEQDDRAAVRLYIDSLGGLVAAGAAVRDTMDYVRVPVHTHCLGDAHGMAVVLLAHGAAGHRSACRDARLSVGEVTESPDRPAPRDRLARMTQMVAEFLSADTGRAVAEVSADLHAGQFFDADQARAYGLIDSVVA